MFESNAGSILRIIYSVELLIAALAVYSVRKKFSSGTIRDFTKRLYISLIVLSITRFMGVTLDFALQIQTGVATLIINDLVWLYYCIYLLIYCFRIIQTQKEVIPIANDLINHALRILSKGIDKSIAFEENLKQK